MFQNTYTNVFRVKNLIDKFKHVHTHKWKYSYIYIYIYRERERERETHTYSHTQRKKIISEIRNHYNTHNISIIKCKCGMK